MQRECSQNQDTQSCDRLRCMWTSAKIESSEKLLLQSLLGSTQWVMRRGKIDQSSLPSKYKTFHEQYLNVLFAVLIVYVKHAHRLLCMPSLPLQSLVDRKRRWRATNHQRSEEQCTSHPICLVKYLLRRPVPREKQMVSMGSLKSDERGCRRKSCQVRWRMGLRIAWELCLCQWLWLDFESRIDEFPWWGQSSMTVRF